MWGGHRSLLQERSFTLPYDEPFMQLNFNQILLTTVALFFPSVAFSYLDPGTGSMILQGLIAGIAIAGFAIKNFWYQILGFFGKKPPSDILDDDDTEEKSKDP